MAFNLTTSGEAEYKRLLNERGGWVVDKFRVVRTPINLPKGLVSVLGIKKPAHHDAFFHLYSEMALRDPKTGKQEVVLLEKNQRINVLRNQSGAIRDKDFKGMEAMEIPIDEKHKGITLNELHAHNWYYHARRGSTFVKYNLVNANCQVFTAGFVNGLGQLHGNAFNFIEQQSETLLPKWLEKPIQGITNLAAGAERFFKGEPVVEFEQPEIPTI